MMAPKRPKRAPKSAHDRTRSRPRSRARRGGLQRRRPLFSAAASGFQDGPGSPPQKKMPKRAPRLPDPQSAIGACPAERVNIKIRRIATATARPRLSMRVVKKIHRFFFAAAHRPDGPWIVETVYLVWLRQALSPPPIHCLGSASAPRGPDLSFPKDWPFVLSRVVTAPGLLNAPRGRRLSISSICGDRDKQQRRRQRRQRPMTAATILRWRAATQAARRWRLVFHLLAYATV